MSAAPDAPAQRVVRYRPGTGVSTHATPLTAPERTQRYFAQTNRVDLTPRQNRRLVRKLGRAMRRGVS